MQNIVRKHYNVITHTGNIEGNKCDPQCFHIKAEVISLSLLYSLLQDNNNVVIMLIMPTDDISHMS